MRGSRTRSRRAPTCPSASKRAARDLSGVQRRLSRLRAATSLTRADLSGEAIRLGRLLVELLPEPEAMGLLALMLLHEAQARLADDAVGRNGAARGSGSVAVGSGADRRRSRARRARAGVAPVRPVHAAGGDRCGARARRRRADATDWAQIVGLYDVLLRADPSPVIELNRAAAIAMRDGPEAGLALIDAILARGDLTDYHLAHAARGDLCRRLGRAR